MSDLPQLAIIIPVYRHSVLLVEAVDAALAQEAPFAIQVIIVNDGCPHAETDETGRALAQAHPDLVTYLKKPNGGLSSARNHGIDHVLAHMPSVQALYMLDADNRLRPRGLARAMAALQEDPSVDWIYPDIDMRGLVSGHDYSGPYSVLLNTFLNTCEAGSLIHRRVFDSGIRFDTGFRSGFEDWDFFLTAAEAGFRGKNIPGMGFLYRKRPESMLAESERDRERLVAGLRAKHRALFSPRKLLDLEQQEAPRYAIFLADQDIVWLTTDPDHPGERLSTTDFALRLWQARSAPGRFALPAFTLVTRSDVLDGLRAAGVLHNMFWQLESLIGLTLMAALVISKAEGDRFGFAPLPPKSRPVDQAGLLMMGTRSVMASAGVPVDTWMTSLAGADPQPSLSLAELTLPPDAVVAGGGVASEALRLIDLMRASPFAKVPVLSDWRLPDLERRRESHLIARSRLGQQPVPPRLRSEGRHIGLVMTIIEFGGVEKVALNLAQAFKARGWQVHLFFISQRDAALGPAWRETLASVNFLGDLEFWNWGGGNKSYFGTQIPKWAMAGNHARLIALLHQMDVVIDLHSGAAMAVMGQLRRRGVVTATSLHLADLSPMGRPSGNPFLGLAYEHAFDLFLPCSMALGDMLHGLGIPEAKIVPLLNAPAFPIPPEKLQATLAARTETRPPRLRALFLGRLDAQKGLQRLAEVIARSAHLPIDWRVIGAQVMEGGPALPARLTEVLEPALSSPEELTAAYDWADVLVHLSEYEGLPLTVLEAMRQGVVPLATNVGAVSEAVSAETGFLLPLEQAGEACLAALTRLCAEPDLLTRLSVAAARQTRSWAEATEDLARALDQLTATRQVVEDSDVRPGPPLKPRPADPPPQIDLTPPGWAELRPGTRARLKPFSPYAGLLQIGAPEGSDAVCDLEVRQVWDREGQPGQILSLRPSGAPASWFSYELILANLNLADYQAMQWKIRLGLAAPRRVDASFIINGAGKNGKVALGALPMAKLGTLMTLKLDLQAFDPEVVEVAKRARLMLSSSGPLMRLDLLAFQITATPRA